MAPAELAGRRVKCRGCGQPIEIPAARSPPRPYSLPAAEAPLVEFSDAVLPDEPELAPMTYAMTVGTAPAGLPPIQAPPPPPPPPPPRRRKKRYKPLYQSASRSVGGSARTFVIGMLIFSATIKIGTKVLPALAERISSSATSGNLLAEAEQIAVRMEGLLQELRSANDRDAVAGIRDRVMQVDSDLQAFLSRARMTKVTRDVAEQFKNKYVPRLQAVTRQLEWELGRRRML